MLAAIMLSAVKFCVVLMRVIMLGVIIKSMVGYTEFGYSESHYAKCHYTECFMLIPIVSILTVRMLRSILFCWASLYWLYPCWFCFSSVWLCLVAFCKVSFSIMSLWRMSLCWLFWHQQTWRRQWFMSWSIHSIEEVSRNNINRLIFSLSSSIFIKFITID